MRKLKANLKKKLIKTYKNSHILIKFFKRIARKIIQNQDRLIIIWMKKRLKSIIRTKLIYLKIKLNKKKKKLIYRLLKRRAKRTCYFSDYEKNAPNIPAPGYS